MIAIHISNILLSTFVVSHLNYCTVDDITHRIILEKREWVQVLSSAPHQPSEAAGGVISSSTPQIKSWAAVFITVSPYPPPPFPPTPSSLSVCLTVWQLSSFDSYTPPYFLVSLHFHFRVSLSASLVSHLPLFLHVFLLPFLSVCLSVRCRAFSLPISLLVFLLACLPAFLLPYSLSLPPCLFSCLIHSPPPSLPSSLPRSHSCPSLAGSLMTLEIVWGKTLSRRKEALYWDILWTS